MKKGTKSVLFGAHCFFLHPFFVAEAWRRLYGFPWDPRLWVAFFVHDLGYVGKANMDDADGEKHVEFGAAVMHLFDWKSEQLFEIARGEQELIRAANDAWRVYRRNTDGTVSVHKWVRSTRWRDFAMYHSRFYSKRDGKHFSKLCIADKMSLALTPAWLYIPMATWSGEIYEYMEAARNGKYEAINDGDNGKEAWYASAQDAMRRFALEHADMREDTWTKV